MNTNDTQANHPDEIYVVMLLCRGGSAPAVCTMRRVLKALIRSYRIKCLAGGQVDDESTGRAALCAAVRPPTTGAGESAA